ncbi:MAG: hydrogen peroxide-inducible genes activator [Parvularculaceae bacterium]
MDADALTLRQLRYLVALDDAKHYRRAAESCGVSQPSLSAQIQNIEDALGVHLVERSRSGVALTPVGREVSGRARQILDSVQSLVDFAAGAQRGLVGTIRLGAKPTLGPYLLPHVVRRLHRQYPDLNLYVRESAPRELEHELARGKHDIILAQLPVAGSELVTERLFREPLYLAVAADHELAKANTVSPSMIKGLDVLSLNPQFHLHDQINDLCKEFGANLVRDYEGTSLDALRVMVGMGMGAAFLPALYVNSEIPARSEVVVKKLTTTKITRSVGLVWRKSAGRADAYRLISDVVRDVVSKRFKDVIVD